VCSSRHDRIRVLFRQIQKVGFHAPEAPDDESVGGLKSQHRARILDVLTGRSQMDVFPSFRSKACSKTRNMATMSCETCRRTSSTS